MGPVVCVWGGDGRNIIIFHLEFFIFNAIIMFCIGVVV